MNTYQVKIWLGAERGDYVLQLTKEQFEAFEGLTPEEKKLLVRHVHECVATWFAER